jgi:hypothetical protein
LRWRGTEAHNKNPAQREPGRGKEHLAGPQGKRSENLAGGPQGKATGLTFSLTPWTAAVLVDERDVPRPQGVCKRRSLRNIGFVSQKKRHGPSLALLLWRLPKAHAWSTTVLVDELGAGGLEGAAFVANCARLHGNVTESRQFSPLLFWRLSKAYAGSATVLVDEFDTSGCNRTHDFFCRLIATAKGSVHRL